MENQKEIPPDRVGIFDRFARNDSFGRRGTDSVRPRNVPSAVGERTGDAATAAGFREGAAELADVFRRLRRTPLQRAGSDQYVERGHAGPQLGVRDDGGG